MFKLEATSDPARFRLNVIDEICVGPPGNVFLFGGVGHAAMVAAMKRVVSRELIWSTAQYLSFARRGMVLDIEVSVVVPGRNISQATVVARVEDQVILTASAAFGARPDQATHQWIQPPAMPAPEDCLALPVWPKQDGGFNKRLEIRLPPGGTGTGPRDGAIEPTGRLQLWIRNRDHAPMDAAQLAILGDFVPAGAASAVGRYGGGNSLDNTLRICRIVPTEWALCDIQMSAMDRGFGHGETRIFAQDGTLLAVAGQSLVLRFLDE